MPYFPLAVEHVVVRDRERDLLSGVAVDGDVTRGGGVEARHVRPRRHEVINGRTERRGQLPLAWVGVDVAHFGSGKPEDRSPLIAHQPLFSQPAGMVNV